MHPRTLPPRYRPATAHTTGIWNALRTIIDPEIGLDIVTLGLVYDVEADGETGPIGETARVTHTLMIPGCPMQAVITAGIRAAIGSVEGAVGACKKSDNAADTTMAAADTSVNAGTGCSTSVNAPAPAPAMTDAGIFAMLSAANQGEIDAGKMAEKKATNWPVRSFAHDMVAAHTKMLNDGVAVAKRLNITPDTVAADSITMMNQSTAAEPQVQSPLDRITKIQSTME